MISKKIFTSLLFVLFGSVIIGQNTTQQTWVNEFNKDKLYVSILDLYHKDAGIDFGDGFFHSRNDTYSSLINLKDEVGSIINYIAHASNIGLSGDVLEIGSFQSTKDNRTFTTLIAWRNENGNYKKELEFIIPQESVRSNAKTAIDEARKQWVLYSNRHTPADLVNNVYTANSIYYNWGKVSNGKKAIIERYAYMNQENWSIELTPEKTLLVHEKLAFEIGNYKSTGIGQYVLIWIQDVDGIWRILFDFNF